MLPLLIVFIALGFILEAISLRRNPDMVELDYNISSGVTEPGSPFRVQTVITNKSRLPISYLEITEIFPTVTEIPDGMPIQMKHDGIHVKNICRIRSRRRKRLTLQTSISKRGVYSFRGASIEFGDFLGFREISKRINNQQDIVVYPEKLENRSLTDALASFCGDVAAKRWLIRDPILTVGCREYTGREPMKDIHWLQSAHRGDIMVREYEYNRQLSVNVVLSVDGIKIIDDESLDKCCSTARTICEELIKKGVPVSFFTNALLQRKSGKEPWRCEATAGRAGGLLEGLGRVSSRSCCSLEKLLEYAVRENDTAASFIIIRSESEKSGDEIIDRLKKTTGQEVLVIQN